MSSVQATAAGRTVASAQPYPWPYHGRLDPRRLALVACVDPAWRVPGPASDAGDLLLGSLADSVRRAGGCVIAVRRMPMRRRPAAVLAAAPPPGAALASVISAPAGAEPSALAVSTAALAAELELDAGGTSAFYASTLDAVLQDRGYGELLVAGWGLEGPVHSTLRDANDRGYECLLVPDACTSLAPELAFSACEMVRFSGGIFGAFADAVDVTQALAELRPAPFTDRSEP